MTVITLRAGNKRKEKVYQEIKNFRGASNKLLDEARLALNEATEALNLIQVQDGLWKPRWGSDYYGMDLGAAPDGAAEFVKSDGTTELIAIAGGKAYKSQDGGAWTEIAWSGTPGTLTAGTLCFFMQIAGYLYIANGTDNLARYNGTTLSSYTQISAPGTVSSVAASSINGAGFTYYAQVTALNDVGETVGSTEVSRAVTKLRDNWVAGTDGITWSWPTVSGATRYQLYIAPESGDESLLISTTGLSYFDDGSIAINEFVQPPLQNTTGAPKFKSMVVSGNRIWATNDANSLYTVYFSGTGQFIGTFSDFYGGGYINLEKGGREIPVAVRHYQSGQGEGRATVLCKTPEGRGAVWQISITTATVGDTSFSVPSGMKVVGSFGTEALLSVVGDNNNLQFGNRKGWFSLGPEKQYYGILRTNELSVKIRPYWRSLIGSQIPNMAAYFFEGKTFISVATNSEGNNRMVILDTERNNWTVDWSIGARQFLEYTDTDKNTHLLYVPVGGTKLIELSESIAGDLGLAYETNYESGRIPVAKLWKDFEKIDKVYIKLGSPRGTINFEVSGTQPTTPFRALATKAISPTASSTGMGFDLMGDVLMGDSEGEPSSFSDSSDPRYVKIGKKLRDMKLRVYTNTIDTDYVLQGFIIEGTPVRKKPPSGWKL